jgi:ribosomal protein L24E
MSDAAELRFFAEVCRALAEGSRDPRERISWSRLAIQWEQMEVGDASMREAQLKSTLPLSC